MRRIVLVTGVVVLSLSVLVLTGTASAQSAISGTVRDESGLALPGVTVEAASEALIERVRTATTDAGGQYRIVDLRPGLYVVTFSLGGFQTLRRAGIELPSEFTLTLNADLSVGQVAETITVSGAAAVIDSQGAGLVTRLDREALDTLPTGQNIWEMAQMVPGINLFNAAGQNAGTVGGQAGATQTYMSVHGMTAAQNVVMVDGMTVSGLEANGSVQAYFNNDMSAETTFQTSGIGADRSGGGVTVNMVPREGGNRLSGNFRMSYRPGEWVGDNFTQRLKDMGMRFVNGLQYLSDVTISEGGPIRRDRVWFFASFHQFDTSDLVPDTVFDDGSQGADRQQVRQGSLRLTTQLSARHKLSAFYDRTGKERSHEMSAQIDPETASSRWSSPNYTTSTIKLTSAFSNRLLFEAGYSLNREYRNVYAQDDVLKARGTPEWIASASRTVQTGGTARTAAPSLPGQDWPARDNLQASVSYVTGSHNVKVGVQYQWGRFFHSNTANADLTQRYGTATRVGNEWAFSSPLDVVVRNTPLQSIDRLNRDLGVYAMDSWRMRRLTVNYGLRWEQVNAQNDAMTVPAGRFVPARSIPAVKNVPDWTDLAPRFAIVYDVFGNAKTALKYSMNRYNRAAATSLAYAFNTLTSTTRTLPWTDLNGNDIAEVPAVYDAGGSPTFCTYLSPGCEINLAALRAANGTLFGTPLDAPRYDPYERTWNLEQGPELEHEILPRVSLSASWFHGKDYDLTKTVNRYRQPGDSVPVTIFNPIDGAPFTVYSIKDTATRDRLAQGGASITYTEPLRRSAFDQISLEFRSRPYSGAQMFGGFVASHQSSTDCETSRPEFSVDPNTQRFCDLDALPAGLTVPWAKDFRIGVSLPIWYNLRLGLTYLNNDEGGYTPNYTVIPGTGPTATRYPDGSPTSPRKVAGQPAPACPTTMGCVPGGLVAPVYVLPTGTTTFAVNLYPPGYFRRERLQQVDIKLSRNFRVNTVTIAPTVEAFNLFNSDKIFNYRSLAYATTTGDYFVPSTILLGRVVGLGLQVRW